MTSETPAVEPRPTSIGSAVAPRQEHL